MCISFIIDLAFVGPSYLNGFILEVQLYKL